MENTREAIDRLRQEAVSGRITCDDVIKRLTAAIEAEYLKAAPNTDFINTCEDFLWELGTQGQQAFESSNQRYIAAIQQATRVRKGTRPSLSTGMRYAVIAAIVLFVLVLGQGAVHFRWFTHGSDQDGEIYVIQGHEVTLELIQSALADHEEDAYISTHDWDELCDFLGFVPHAIAPEMLDATTVEYTAHIEPGVIVFDALYRDVDKSTSAVFKQEYYSDFEEAYFIIEQDTQGVYQTINGYQVYHNTNLGRQALAWLTDSTLNQLYGEFEIDVGTQIIEQLTRGR